MWTRIYVRVLQTGGPSSRQMDTASSLRRIFNLDGGPLLPSYKQQDLHEVGTRCHRYPLSVSK
jgi:hypothetical protein